MFWKSLLFPFFLRSTWKILSLPLSCLCGSIRFLLSEKLITCIFFLSHPLWCISCCYYKIPLILGRRKKWKWMQLLKLICNLNRVMTMILVLLVCQPRHCVFIQLPQQSRFNSHLTSELLFYFPHHNSSQSLWVLSHFQQEPWKFLNH